jgi:hypothetical protein
MVFRTAYGVKIGSDRRIYICIYERKNQHAEGKYFTYLTHFDETWPPSAEQVVSSIEFPLYQ